MAENSHQPKADDAFLGSQFPPPLNGVILGGLLGVKQRLAKGTTEQKIDALLDAFQYGGTLQGHSSKIERIALSADRQFIVSYSADKTIKVWGIP